MLEAIETTGEIDVRGRLVLDGPLPVSGPSRCRVIVLLPDDEPADGTEWLRAAATNRAFGFLKDAREDIYTLADGEPFRD